MAEANSPTPLYYRVYAVMRERIVNGYYPEGAPLPSEAELSGRFAVSRITIRRAMMLLTAERLVTRTRGKGTFVRPDAKDDRINRVVVSDVTGLLSYLNMVGQRTMLRVISLDRGEAPPRICAQMGIAATSEVVRATRIRDLNGTPYSLSKAYLLPEVGGKFTKKI